MQVFLENVYKTETVHTDSHYQTPHLRHLNICDCANKKNTHRMSKKVLSNLQIRLLGRIAWEWSKAVAGYVLKVLLSLFCYYYHILHHFESASFIWHLSHILEIPDSHDCLPQVDDGHWGAVLFPLITRLKSHIFFENKFKSLHNHFCTCIVNNEYNYNECIDWKKNEEINENSRRCFNVLYFFLVRM